MAGGICGHSQELLLPLRLLCARALARSCLYDGIVERKSHHGDSGGLTMYVPPPISFQGNPMANTKYR